MLETAARVIKMSSQAEKQEDGEFYLLPFSGTTYPYVSHGLAFPQACAKHVSNTFKASRVYIIASGSLARNTDYVRQLQQTLGEKVVGTRAGMTPHTLWSEILEIAEECRELEADLIVTLGAGSLTDGAKIIALALANNAKHFDDLATLTTGEVTHSAAPAKNKPATVPIISIPTSLSGGEYSDLAGGTHDGTSRKHPFIDGSSGPKLVILDPQLTTTTPDKYWLSTGIRAVDHCVEALCSLINTTKASDADCERGLRLLVPGLLRCKADPQDLEARLSCQMGVIEAVKAVFQHQVPLGASHGIGHQLGPLGVGHGETSCICLPAVCRYNVSVNDERQAAVCKILWSEVNVASILREGGLKQGTADLSAIMNVVIRALGMPRTLKEVGVGEEKFELLARNSLTDKWCVTNPRSLTEENQVLEILEMVKG